MRANSLLLARRYTERPDHAHDGNVVTLRSNLRSPSGSNRWRLDGSLLGRLRVRLTRNGDVVRGDFLIDACDREIMGWRAVANAGTSSSDIQDMMLEAVEARFGDVRSPQPVEMLDRQRLSLHGPRNPHLRPPTRPEAVLHPDQKPQSNGVSEAFSTS